MSSIFKNKALMHTENAINDANEKKYLKSWIDTIPARIYYLADVIANIAIIPFSILKTGFYSIEALYTWGNEIENLNDAIKSLYKHTNDLVTSTIGIFFTSKAKELYKKNNLFFLLRIASVIASICLAILAISKVSGFEIYINPDGSLSPDFYWDLTRRSAIDTFKK
jgi:hypothetical protein